MIVAIIGGNHKLILELIQLYLDTKTYFKFIIIDKNNEKLCRERIYHNYAHLIDIHIFMYDIEYSYENINELNEKYHFTHIVNNVKYNSSKTFEKNFQNLNTSFLSLCKVINTIKVPMLNIQRNVKCDTPITGNNAYSHNTMSLFFSYNQEIIIKMMNVEHLIKNLIICDFIQYENYGYSNKWVDYYIKNIKAGSCVYIPENSIFINRSIDIVREIATFLEHNPKGFLNENDNNIQHIKKLTLQTIKYDTLNDLFPVMMKIFETEPKFNKLTCIMYITSRGERRKYVLTPALNQTIRYRDNFKMLERTVKNSLE
jgi:ribosomal protein L30E